MEPPPLPSPKKILPALVLGGTVGFLGLHRFYAGRYVTGLIQLVLFIAGSLMLGSDFTGIASLRTLDDFLAWSSEHPVRPGPVLLLALPMFWVLADCLVLAARRFRDGAGRRMVRWV